MTRATRTRAAVAPRQSSKAARDEADKRLMRGAAALLGFVFDIAPASLMRETRGPGMEAEARQLMLSVVRRAKALTPDPSSIQRIGRAIGRDRTTVAHALHKVESAAEQNDPLDAFIDKLAHVLVEFIAMQDLAHELLSAGIESAGTDDERD